VGRVESIGVDVIVDIDPVKACASHYGSQHLGKRFHRRSAGHIVCLAGIYASGCRGTIREQLVAREGGGKGHIDDGLEGRRFGAMIGGRAVSARFIAHYVARTSMGTGMCPQDE
jgi:hypothetical protein